MASAERPPQILPLVFLDEGPLSPIPGALPHMPRLIFIALVTLWNYPVSLFAYHLYLHPCEGHPN